MGWWWLHGGKSATHIERRVGVYFETLTQVSVIENSEGQTMLLELLSDFES